MESQFLSPVGVPPHLRSEGIYRVHTSVYTLFQYFTFQTLDAVSTKEFILTMHHDNNNRCEKNK